MSLMSEFSGAAMASGYAKWRPPVHPLVIDAARPYIGDCAVGLDVGCGAGLSTNALKRVARVCIGIDPVESMVRAAGDGFYAVAAAEHIPLRTASVDLLSAAGSLNYADLERFFPEALRVLAPGGMLLVYDFSAGRLDNWLDEFQRRYPPPAGSARALDPDILRDLARGFRLIHAENFEYAVPMTPDFYLEYILTETSVSHAVQRGASPESIRKWCAESLSFFQRPRDILFAGYFVIFQPG